MNASSTADIRPASVEVEIQPSEQLLVLPLPMREVDGHVLFDMVSRESLIRYLAHFKTLIVASPRMSESKVNEYKNFVWVPVDDLQDRVQFVLLPEYGSIRHFLQEYKQTARLLRRCINASRYIQCAIGGGNGGLEHDWAAVAAEEAIKAGRKFAIWADGVSFEGLAQKADAARGISALPRRLKLRLKAWLVRRWQLRLINRCDLLYCNGMTTFLALSPHVKAPGLAHKIYDLQIGADKYLSQEQMELKTREVLEKPTIRVCYAGRALNQKAPLQWIRAIKHARDLGAPIVGTWLGDGTLLEAMRDEVKNLGLTDVIDLTGFVADRDRVIEAIRESDILPFTHIEPESPRVLIEALLSACPIVGYQSPYPEELVSAHGGGLMTPMGEPQALGRVLADLAFDRNRLADLIHRAWLDGARFDSDQIFQTRSQLMRDWLD